MKCSKGLIAAGLLGMAATASAGEFSGTVTAVSDYSFRAISLTASDPALQGSIDWAHDSGFYAGVWASNIDYGSDVDGDIELDLYLGWAGETGGGFGWDAGIVWYTYPDSSSSLTKSKINDYAEIYASIAKGPFELKQWYAYDYVGADVETYYTEANVSIELPAAFGLHLHAGYNYGNGFGGSDYFDYSAGVAYTLGNFNLELKYVDTDLDSSDGFFVTDDLFNTEGRAIFSVSTTFPWSAE